MATLTFILGSRQNKSFELLSNLNFNIQRLSEITTFNYYDVDYKSFELFNGRAPFSGEIKCALIHLKSYKKLLKSEFPFALIFEDDALLDEVSTEQIKFAVEFMENLTAATILSLYTEIENYNPDPKKQVSKLNFMPSFAVAYLINKAAANTLVNLNYPVSFRADWPIELEQIDFYALNETRVKHGSSSNGIYSSIITDNNRDIRLINKILMYCGIWYWLKSSADLRKHISFWRYYDLALKNKLRYHKYKIRKYVQIFICYLRF